MKTQFYKGQKVWDPRYEGEGVVTHTDWGHSFYKLRVEFNDGTTEYYSSDGRDNQASQYPLLSTQEYHRPEPQWIPQKGELVWVRGMGAWQARYFSHLVSDIYGVRYACFHAQDYEEDKRVDTWTHCHPFEPRPF